MRRQSKPQRQHFRRKSLVRLCTLLAAALAGMICLSPGFAADAQIQIRDLDDIDFGAVPPTIGDVRADASFCVAMAPRGRYSLIGRGDGPSGTFALTETGTEVHHINYIVRISDLGRRFGRVLRPGVAMNNLRASRQRQNGNCRPEARIRIVVRGSQIAAAYPGRYEGTLSLTVVPE